MKFRFDILFILVTVLFLIKDVNPSHQNEIEQIVIRPQHVDDRQWHRWLMRGGKIEPAKMVKARKMVKDKIEAKKFLRDAGMYQWSSVGPRNIGGRIRAIALQPDGSGGENIFIGAAGGGIWKSTNGGSSWSANNDFSPSMAVTSIVVHPMDPNILFASTGEGQAVSTIGIPGAGIFKSTNGGNSWFQLPSTNDEKFYWVNKIAINPENGDHLLAVTTNLNKEGGTFGQPFNGGGQLYESLDGGSSWSLKFSGKILTDVEFHPFNSKVRVVSGHGTLKVYNSSNGLYEEKVTNNVNEILNYGHRIEITIHPLNLTTIIYALLNIGNGNGIVYQSLDGGNNWDIMGAPALFGDSKNFGNYSNTIQVDPINYNTIYLGGVDLWKSTNGGITFDRISHWQDYHNYANAQVYQNCQLHADQHIVIPSLFYSSNNRKMYIGNDGGIQSTDNISTASTDSVPLQTSGWNNLIGSPSGLGITQFYAGAVSPNTTKFGGGTQDNGIQSFENGAWTQPNTGDGHQMIYHPIDSNIVWANVNYNSLYKSTDGGVTFNFTEDLGEEEAMLIAPMAMNLQNPDHIYLGGKSLWRYNDSNGMNTMLKPAYPPLIIGTDTIDRFITEIAIDSMANSIWLGYSHGVVEFSINGGTTWSGDVSSNLASKTAVTDIDIDPNNSSGLNIILTYGGYNKNNIWKMLKQGSGFDYANISLTFDMHVNTITHHPTFANWIYIGTDVGVFASMDYGNNWSLYPSSDNYNEGPAYLEVTDLFWSSAPGSGVYNLWAATFGRGLFISSGVTNEAFVDINHNGLNQGTRQLPFDSFIEGMIRAGGQGTDLIILGAGVHQEINSSTLFDRPVLITNELPSGQSAIIE